MGKFKKALKALEGMRQIVENEMLTREDYVLQDFFLPERQTAVCQGHRFCAIGALWAGGGIKVERGGSFTLPGAREEDREDFLADHPSLAMALRALDHAADLMADREGWSFPEQFSSPMEDLFEAQEIELGRPELLELIDAAASSILRQRAHHKRAKAAA